jgi:hypothetical protein
MSQDEHFDETGDTTNIDWKASFNNYLKLLTTGYNAKKKDIYDLIKHWDDQLYPNTTSSLANPTNAAAENSDSDNEEAMAALNAGHELEISGSSSGDASAVSLEGGSADPGAGGEGETTGGPGDVDEDSPEDFGE